MRLSSQFTVKIDLRNSQGKAKNIRQNNVMVVCEIFQMHQ